MKRLSLVAALFSALLLAGGALFAEEQEPTAEQILEECIAEAYQKGYDIEQESFQDELTEAIVNENEAKVKEICPKTYAKYPD